MNVNAFDESGEIESRRKTGYKIRTRIGREIARMDQISRMIDSGD